MAIEMVPYPETEKLTTVIPSPEFASYLTETADGEESQPETFPDAEPLPSESLFPEEVEKKEKKREHKKKMSKKMKQTMERFQGMFTDGIAGWFHQQAIVSGHPEWDLETKDAELIGDSIDFVMQAFNVEFDFETVELKLTSIWWVFLYPLCAFGIVFLNKKGAVDRKVSQNENN
jgi:hypothetical protein